MFLECFVEVFLPAVAAVVFLAFIVVLCGYILGIVPQHPNHTTDKPQAPKEKQADSPGLLQVEMTDEQAVDEKTLLKIEMKILEEMQQTRQARLDRLVENDWRKK